MNWQELRFRWRLKSRAVKVWVVNLSWAPVWFLRKEVQQKDLRWTPAATVRHLAKQVKYLEGKNEHLLRSWKRTEEELRAERLSRASDSLSPEAKDWAEEKMGVRFRGSERN